MSSMCIGWQIVENYHSSGIVKIYRINCENSLSNKRRERVLESKLLTRICNSNSFSLLLT